MSFKTDSKLEKSCESSKDFDLVDFERRLIRVECSNEAILSMLKRWDLLFVDDPDKIHKLNAEVNENYKFYLDKYEKLKAKTNRNDKVISVIYNLAEQLMTCIKKLEIDEEDDDYFESLGLEDSD